MAKKPNRSELRQLTKDLGLFNDLPHDGLVRLLDTAQEQPDPEHYLRELAKEKSQPRRVTNIEALKERIADHEEFNAVDNLKPVIAEALAEVLSDKAHDPETQPTNSTPGWNVSEEARYSAAAGDAQPQIEAIDDGHTYIHLPNLAHVRIEPSGHQSRRIDANLTGFPLARLALTKLRHHLDNTNARCTKNKHVESPARAIIWLLEQYGRACGLESPVPRPSPPAPNAQETAT